ncbi:UDP-N-acetylglucosamine 2-epimerase (non-hydrolyzing) [Methanospirillum stamsii]|uniref:UDP-N-acetylglucosamine 2-epimerase (Non-hydrolyzing) n=1 Tax=Methanospirillum stamsii TaxID=1277351 RepID=A0A2V2N023_9EURY|nr:UDP-N-acetylglucosamine 2-epimerase (non-hydrolyzing) [Methanospirillum stamsii]PWR69507.1 UDP-N-acetylglucosamine 2-epimerase (non-hydrolyzing) [Methanospirillum stamsii]
MTILSIVGARPQFIKCAPLSKKIREWCTEILVHTGQHYDENMSDVFFSELGIPNPDYNLHIGSGNHGEQTGKMLEAIEQILLDKKPNLVLVYGDTNSTIAGSLAASKLHIPVAHVEAGLRSYDRRMPEEINRVLTDHVSDLLFCPTQTAVRNLEKEGITRSVYITGDVMVDAIFKALPVARKMSNVLADIQVFANEYYLATIHRPSNTDDKKNLVSILQAFSELSYPVVFPIHPRTRKFLESYGISISEYPNIIFVAPLPYVDMVRLLFDSRLVLTDSGGLQKEAYILKKPCVTLRDTTEWVETVEDGWNILAGADKIKIVNSVSILDGYVGAHRQCYGDGYASDIIVKTIVNFLSH